MVSSLKIFKNGLRKKPEDREKQLSRQSVNLAAVRKREMENKKPTLRAVERASSHTSEVYGGWGEWDTHAGKPRVSRKACSGCNQ